MIAAAVITFVALYVLVVVLLSRVWRWLQDVERANAQRDVREYAEMRRALDRAGRE